MNKDNNKLINISELAFRLNLVNSKMKKIT